MTVQPILTLEAAWGSAPFAASPAWTDLDAAARLVSANLRRVKGQAGVCTFVLHNQDDYFNSWNTASPAYPNVQPMRKIRLSSEWNLLTANQSSVETGTAGLAAGTNSTISRTTARALDGVASLLMQSVAAGTMSATTEVTRQIVTEGLTYTAMAHFSRNASERSVRVSIRWFNLGVLLSTTVGTTVVEPPSAAYVHAEAAGVAPAGANRADLLVEVLATGAALEQHYVDQLGLFEAADFPAAGSNVWSVGGPKYLFTGYIESIDHEWSNINYGDVTITAVDAFKAFTLAKPAGTAYHDAVMTDTPTAYYKLGEAENGATSGSQPAALDSSGNTNTAQYNGTPSFGAVGALPAEAGTAVDFGNRQTYVGTPNSANPSGTANFSVECWVFPRAFPTVNFADKIWAKNSTETLDCSLRTDGTLYVVVSDGTNGGTLDSSVALTPNRWNHVVFTKSGTVGPVAAAWKLYLNGVDVSTAPVVIGTGNCNLAVSTGIIGGKWVSAGVLAPSFDGLIDEHALYATTAISAARVTAHYDAAKALNANSLAGARITALLDLIGWPAADRTLDAGQYQMQPMREPIFDTPPLAYFHKLVDSEGWPAAFFVDAAGKAVFQDRAHATPANSGTFSDAGTLMYDAGVGPTRSDRDLWTAVAYQADGGAPQVAEDATAATDYIRRTRTVTGLQNALDANVATVAAADLARFKTPRDRIGQVVLHPIDDPGNLWPQALSTELNDRKSVVRTAFPGGGSTLTLDVRVAGIEHRIVGADWHTVWTVEPT